MIVNRSLLFTVILCSASALVSAEKFADKNIRAPKAVEGAQEVQEAEVVAEGHVAMEKAQRGADWGSWSSSNSWSLSVGDENERPSRNDRHRNNRHRRHDRRHRRECRRHGRRDCKDPKCWERDDEIDPIDEDRDRRTSHHDHHDRCTSHHEHDHHHKHCDRCEECPLRVNGGWKEFIFGEPGTFVDACFVFETQGPSTLRITDNFCTGDIFKVYDWDKLLFETSKARFDNCATNTTDPDYAFESRQWSSGRATLRPGSHKITIQVVKSPYKAGGANIRVDSVLSSCPSSLNKLTVVNSPVPFSQAESVCRRIGKQLADLDIYNFLDATTLAFKCAGPFSMVWMKSYWKDTYNNSCLALHTGAAAPGGSINVADCSAHLPVLCQEIGATAGDGVRPPVDPYVSVIEELPCNDEHPYCRPRPCGCKGECKGECRRRRRHHERSFSDLKVDPFRSSRLPSGWSSTISSFHDLPLEEEIDRPNKPDHHDKPDRHDRHCHHKQPCHKEECHKKPHRSEKECHKKESNNKPHHGRHGRRHRRHHQNNRHGNLNIRHQWGDKNNLNEDNVEAGDDFPVLDKVAALHDKQ